VRRYVTAFYGSIARTQVRHHRKGIPIVTTLMTEPTDEDALRQCVESIVRDRRGGRLVIAGIHRQRFDLSTSYACDTVTIELATGDELKIFLKNFGVSQLPKDGLQQRRERELRVYRRFLADADLGTATYYGAVRDESHTVLAPAGVCAWNEATRQSRRSRRTNGWSKSMRINRGIANVDASHRPGGYLSV
jgi:hypothetical protein